MDFKAGERIYVDKPLTWTSFDVVNKIRFLLKRHLGIKKIKVGHAGTLDPLATGLVIVCTGRQTKTLEELMGHDKEYEATLKLGATTPSFDKETEEDMTYPTEHITEELVRKVLSERFTGEIDQTPPTFSAIRVDGHRAYEYARKGKDGDLKLESRRIKIYKMEVMSYAPGELSLRIGCSKGTYIRALARDIGEALGSGAYLTSLRRTRVGVWSVEEAMSMAEVERLIEKEGEQSHEVETA